MLRITSLFIDFKHTFKGFKPMFKDRKRTFKTYKWKSHTEHFIL